MDDENGKEGLLTSIEDKNEGIDIKNIMFKYDPHALRKTIDDVNIHIPQGKVTAIVGASGSGKTTLIRLMLGFIILSWRDKSTLEIRRSTNSTKSGGADNVVLSCRMVLSSRKYRKKHCR